MFVIDDARIDSHVLEVFFVVLCIVCVLRCFIHQIAQPLPQRITVDLIYDHDNDPFKMVNPIHRVRMLDSVWFDSLEVVVPAATADAAAAAAASRLHRKMLPTMMTT